MPKLTDLVTESTVASIMVAALAIAGEANGTIAIAIIGAIHIIDLPVILKVVCEQARANCSN